MTPIVSFLCLKLGTENDFDIVNISNEDELDNKLRVR